MGLNLFHLCRADCRLLFSRYIYHAWKSILAIPGGAQQHTVTVGDYICESNFAGQDRVVDRH